MNVLHDNYKKGASVIFVVEVSERIYIGAKEVHAYRIGNQAFLNINVDEGITSLSVETDG